MKGNVVGGMIAVMVACVLAFAVVAPIMNNATLGTEYTNQSWTNSSQLTDTKIYFNTTCRGIRSDTTYLHVWNSTGDDLTSVTAVDYADGGGLAITNATTYGSTADTASVTGTVSYRCTGDSAYIDDNTSRTMANYILPIVLIFIIVGITALFI